MLQPYERLKKVFDGHADRLKNRFGISLGLAYKWMRDTDDLGTGTPNPLQRGRDLVDEALIIDPSGEGARLIALDGIEYYESLTNRKIESLDQLKEVTSLLEKTFAVTSKLTIPDIKKLSQQEKKDLSEKVSNMLCAGERIRRFINSEMNGGSRAREFVAPRSG